MFHIVSGLSSVLDYGMVGDLRMQHLFLVVAVDKENFIKKGVSQEQLHWDNSNHASIHNILSSVSWDCRIHRLHFCGEVRPQQRVSGYDIKQSNGEGPVILKFGRMQNNLSLPFTPR